MTALRGILVLAVVAILVAVAGVAMGDAPRSPDPAPSAADVAAARQRIAAGGPVVQEGKREFDAEGCAGCHAIAATGAAGKLGPRLDTLADDSVQDDIDNIVKPRADVVEGYEADLMPTDYAKRIPADEIKAIATFIKAASGGKAAGGGS
jgi:mono/diheme cytochrome c family protein